MVRPRSETNSNTSVTHRFLDEAGDTTFYGKGRASIVGKPGVSLSFAIGMVKFNADLNGIRKAVRALQDEVTADKYLLGIASVAKKAAAGGFYFHATDDPPEVRERFFKFIENLNCTCEVMVARKLPSMFALKHHHQEAEFYADVLSHLLKNKLKLGQKVVLNIADYLCWSVQRIFERGETRYYDFMGDKIRLVVDLYASANYEGSLNYYRWKRRLTAENKLSPPSP
jgi:hypothetical protein